VLFLFTLKHNLHTALVAHAYNPSYLGDQHQEDHGLRTAWANSLKEPPHLNLQNNQIKMDWRYGSSDRVPAFKCEALSSTSVLAKKQNKTKTNNPLQTSLTL
jgi:hypothetical protein